jgi:hypothetical protein
VYNKLVLSPEDFLHRALAHCLFDPLRFYCCRQRRQYKLLRDGKQTTLTPERLEMLNHLGFIWDSHQVTWSEKFQSLLEYKKENGNCNVPSNNSKHKKLATWIKCQRRQYKLYLESRASSMTADRISELNTIGFNWEIRRVGASRMSRTPSKEHNVNSSTPAEV